MKHLKEQDLTYFQHLCGAWSFALKFIFVGIAELIHGVCPYFFEYDIMRFVKNIYEGRKLNEWKNL